MPSDGSDKTTLSRTGVWEEESHLERVSHGAQARRRQPLQDTKWSWGLKSWRLKSWRLWSWRLRALTRTLLRSSMQLNSRPGDKNQLYEMAGVVTHAPVLDTGLACTLRVNQIKQLCV